MSAQHERIAELQIDRQERERQSTPKAALILISIALLGVAGAAAWWISRETEPQVRLVTVIESGGSAHDGATVLDASGYVVARLQATVSSKITGKIVEVLVECRARSTKSLR